MKKDINKEKEEEAEAEETPREPSKLGLLPKRRKVEKRVKKPKAKKDKKVNYWLLGILLREDNKPLASKEQRARHAHSSYLYERKSADITYFACNPN